MRVVIVMGVATSGKSTVGAQLARELGWEFVEGDDLHPPQNRAKMARGVALEDEDRWGWLEAIRRVIEQLLNEGKSVVVACSALKRAYREVLRAGIEQESGVVHLRLSRATARQRVSTRRGHVFPASLLESQFATLEEPVGEAGVLHVDGARPVEEIVGRAREWLRGKAAEAGFRNAPDGNAAKNL